MKTFLHYLTVATLLAFYSTTNAAEGFNFGGEGVYFGVGIGYTSVDYEPVIENGIIRRPTDDSDTGFRVFAGYDFTDNFGVEVGYARLGDPGITLTDGSDTLTGPLDIDAYSLVGVLRYPFTDTADIFFKLGGARTSLEAEINVGGGLSVSDSEDDSGTTYGLGARYLLNKFFISAEWQNYDQDIDLFSLGIGYHF